MEASRSDRLHRASEACARRPRTQSGRASAPAGSAPNTRGFFVRAIHSHPPVIDSPSGRGLGCPRADGEYPSGRRRWQREDVQRTTEAAADPAAGRGKRPRSRRIDWRFRAGERTNDGRHPRPAAVLPLRQRALAAIKQAPDRIRTTPHVALQRRRHETPRDRICEAEVGAMAGAGPVRLLATG